MKDRLPTWAIQLVAVFGLVAAGSALLVTAAGWPWFAEFLGSSAPNWLQAIGALVAIWAAYHIGSAQVRTMLAVERQRTVDADLRYLKTIRDTAEFAVDCCSRFKREWDDEPLLIPEGPLADMDGFREFLKRVDPMASPLASIGAQLIRLPSTFARMDHAVKFAQGIRLTSESEFDRAHDGLERALAQLQSDLSGLAEVCRTAAGEISKK